MGIKQDPELIELLKGLRAAELKRNEGVRELRKAQKAFSQYVTKRGEIELLKAKRKGKKGNP